MARGHKRRMALNAEINVVSLIDVILLLLLIFMITAPMMTSGIDLQLPVGTVQPIESKNAIMVEVNGDGRIFVDGQDWGMARLQTGFPTYARGRGEVTLRGDFRRTYGNIFEVMAVLKAAGVKELNLAGEEINRGR